ncbi:MAG: PKD domain-containing protein, partial [Bacteroidales bacterium]
QPYTSDTCNGFKFAPINVNYTNGTGIASYQWYSNSTATTVGATVISGQTLSSYTPSATIVGTTYYYCVISFSSSGGCASITSNIIEKTLHPKPNASYTYTPISGGTPLNVNFTNLSTILPLSYVWSFGYNYPNLTSQNPLVSFTNTGIVDSIYNANLIVTTIPFGCKDTVVHSVTIHPLPIPNFSTSNVCFGDSVIFTDMSINTVGTINKWHWNFGNGDTSNVQNPHYLYAAPNTYSVTLTVTNNLNISNSISKNITIYPLPVPKFTTTYDTLGCVTPASVNFTNTSTGATSYKWLFGDGTFASSFNSSHVYVDTGYYNVKLIDTTQFGCVDSVKHKIHIINPPNTKFSLSVSDSCGPLPVTFTNYTSGLYLSYLWNFNIGTPSTSVLSGPFTKVYPPGINDSIFYVSLKASNICGTRFYYDTITVFPKPITDFGITQNWACSPSPVLLLDTILGHPDSLTWSFGDGSAVIHSNIFSQVMHHTFYYTGNDDTTYKITLIAYNECGSDTTIKYITVLPKSITAFFNTDTLKGCAPLTVNYTSYSQGAINYNWNFGDSAVSNQASVSHTYTAPGNYVTYLAVNNTCSTDTMRSDTIRVFPSPIVGFNYSGNHCIYDTVSFNSITTGLAQYTWSFGDGGQSNLSNPKHKFNHFGNFPVYLVAYSSNGCSDTSRQIVNIRFTPTAKFNISNRSGCHPFQTTILNQTDSLSLNNYAWTFGNGNTSGLIQPTPQTFLNANNCADTFMYINLIAENLGCYDTISDSVRVLPMPLSKFSLLDSCSFENSSLVQVNNQSVCATSYIWKLNGISIQDSTQINPLISIPNTGYYTIQNVAYNIFHCVGTSE